MAHNEKNFYPRTDLAIEIGAQVNQSKSDDYDIEGVSITINEVGNAIKTTHVHIENEKGMENMGKPIGHYVTVECQEMKENNPDAHCKVIEAVAYELEKLLPKEKDKHILIVGLGNRFATPDTLGPHVSGKVLVTRHLKEHAPEAIDESISIVSSLTPGVMGLTGIETSEIIEGVVKNTKPDCIIAIDALAARNIERINTTIQITDTGISPGAGVGNKRKQLNEETVGCPVIAIGVPTVIDAATLVHDTLDHLIDNMLTQAENTSFYEMLKSLSSQEKYTLIREILASQIGNLFVTPKDIDEIISYLTHILFNSINIAVHPGITINDIDHYAY